MKHGTAINCIEFTGGNMLRVPPAADPNEVNLNLEVKVYKLNPDGSKGELIRTDPAFPEGWDLPKFNPNIKEEEKMYPPREDKAEIMATAKKLMSEGHTQRKAAEILNVSVSTLATWLSLEKKKQQKAGLIPGTHAEAGKNTTPPPKPEMGCPFDEPVFNPDMPVDKPEPVNYDQAVNQLTLSFIFDIYDSDLPPVDKLGLIAKQIDVWREL